MDLHSLLYIFAGGTATALATYYLIKSLFPWIKYDIHFIRVMGKISLKVKSFQRRRMGIVEIFEQQVKKYGKKTMLIFEDQRYTYEYVNKQANKVAHVAIALGFKKGDVVAMLQLNEPAFIWTYFGLVKVGVLPAFLNTNLRSKSLLHCFKVSEARALFIGQGQELLQAVQYIYDEVSNNNNGTAIYVQGSKGDDLPQGFKSFDELMEQAPEEDLDPSVRSKIHFQDGLNFIFTSGTTGLPKAAVVTQSKGVKGSLLIDSVGVTSDDIFYTPLPLYHSAAGIIALGSTITSGGTLVLRRKFSATHFFEDCAKYDVTVVQYIGELCRYLCAKKPAPSDRAHKVRIAFGNGLRTDIWDEFKTRFNIPIIGEFYAATEGNAGFINFFNKKGCIGRNSPLLRFLPIRMIRYSVEKDCEIRNEQGFCINVPPGEPGLMVAQIRRDFEFDGYKGNNELSEKKILRNVFKEGDCYFNTGDLLVMDKEYFVYFSDRIGDTFRWKGENVATIEVSNVVSDVSWIEDATVFGVQIPGQDGRCGMAALTLTEDHVLSPDDLTALYKHCEDLLPTYARPRFLRVLAKAMQVTATFKQQKFTLVNQGYDPSKCGDDRLYMMDVANKTFQTVDENIFRDINEGKIRL